MHRPQKFHWTLKNINLYQGVDYLCHTINEPFSLEWALKTIKDNCHIFNPTPDEHIKSLLDASEYLGIVHQPTPIYYPAAILFENTDFVLYPSTQELQEGSLILGDSLKPYCAPMLPFEKFTFYDSDDKIIKVSWMSCSYDELKKWYLEITRLEQVLLDNLLMGNFLNLTDKPQNDSVYTKNYRIPTLIFKDFYQKNNFKPGDGIVFKVKNYHKGIFSISALKSSPKTNLKFRSIEFQMQIERSIIEEMDHTGVYPLVYKALTDCYARMRHTRQWQNLSPMAWSKYLRKSKKLNIFNFNHETVIYKGTLDPVKRAEIIQELSWPCSKMENLEDVLTTTRCNINLDVLVAYAHSFMDQGGLSHVEFFKTIFKKFGDSPLDHNVKPIFDVFALKFWKQQVQANGRQKSTLIKFCRDEALELYENALYLYGEINPFTRAPLSEKLNLLYNIRLSCELVLTQLNDNQLIDDEVIVLRQILKDMADNLSSLGDDS